MDFLWGLSPEEGADYILKNFGVKLVFVTCGPNGCIFKNQNACGTAPSLEGIPVSDTTGAWDIFGGSALWKVLSLGKAPGDLSEAELREVTTFACTAAGLSTTRSGGISSVPSYDEVMERMARA